MPTENELKPLADEGPVERMVRPRAWAVGASFWGSLESVPYMLRAEAEPLYDSEALDIYRSLANEFQRAHKEELKAKSPGRNHPKGQPDWLRGLTKMVTGLRRPKAVAGPVDPPVRPPCGRREQMERVTKNLNAAIATMRAACDDAERRARDGNAYAVQQVLHALSWGMANASSSIECAMAAVEDEHDKQKAEFDAKLLAAHLD